MQRFEKPESEPFDQRLEPGAELESQPGQPLFAKGLQDALREILPGSAVFVDDDAAEIEERIL